MYEMQPGLADQEAHCAWMTRNPSIKYFLRESKSLWKGTGLHVQVAGNCHKRNDVESSGTSMPQERQTIL